MTTDKNILTGHSRENGNPENTRKYWIPASAGMTSASLIFSANSVVKVL